MNQLLGGDKTDAHALYQMRLKGGIWAAYQNQDLGSSNIGHLQFLKIGPGCTHLDAPSKYPADTAWGMGWRYLLVGYVDLGTGAIGQARPEPQAPDPSAPEPKPEPTQAKRSKARGKGSQKRA